VAGFIGRGMPSKTCSGSISAWGPGPKLLDPRRKERNLEEGRGLVVHTNGTVPFDEGRHCGFGKWPKKACAGADVFCIRRTGSDAAIIVDPRAVIGSNVTGFLTCSLLPRGCPEPNDSCIASAGYYIGGCSHVAEGGGQIGQATFSLCRPPTLMMKVYADTSLRAYDFGSMACAYFNVRPRDQDSPGAYAARVDSKMEISRRC